MVTLREWQQTIKNKHNFIVNASHPNGDDRPLPFPIGMCYRYVKYHDLNTQIGDHSKLLLVAIAITDIHSKNKYRKTNRISVIHTLSTNGFINTHLQDKEYFSTLPSYKFIASPEGRGMDCHRHYEALMAGCIPIIERNPHIEEKYKGCPILWTNDYSEITSEYLNQKYLEMIDKDYDFSKLFLSNQSLEHTDAIKKFCNFWTMKKLNKTWY